MSDLMFNRAILNIGEGDVDLDTDTMKCILITGAPVATWENLADVTNELIGSGYTAGGVAVACTFTESGGVATFNSADPTWNPLTATGVLHALWYSDTSTNDKLICSKDLGGSQSVTANEFKVSVHADGLFTIP